MSNITSNPTSDISNILSTSGVTYINTTPTWNPDIDPKKARIAIDENTNEIWLWDKNKIAAGDGAWVLYGLGSTTLQAEIDKIIALTGLPLNSENLGTFPGTVIPDNVTIKQALTELEAAVTLPTFVNGLTKTGSDVKLGGPLTQDTIIGSQTGTDFLSLQSANGVYVNGNNFGVETQNISLTSLGNGASFLASSAGGMSFSAASLVILSSDLTGFTLDGATDSMIVDASDLRFNTIPVSTAPEVLYIDASNKVSRGAAPTGSGPSSNIYTADGTLTSSRTIDADNHDLTFKNVFNYAVNTAGEGFNMTPNAFRYYGSGVYELFSESLSIQMNQAIDIVSYQSDINITGVTGVILEGAVTTLSSPAIKFPIIPAQAESNVVVINPTTKEIARATIEQLFSGLQVTTGSAVTANSSVVGPVGTAYKWDNGSTLVLSFKK